MTDTQQSSGNNLLIDAVLRGDVKLTQEALDAGIDINSKSGYGGYTALIAAAARSFYSTGTLSLLLESGANPDLQNDIGMTALSAAAKTGREPSVKALLEAGATVDLPDQWGNTPLFYAAGAGSTRVVRLLVEAGADIETRGGYYGATPLSLAAVEGDEMSMRVLLEAGADMNAQDKEGATALMWALDDEDVQGLEQDLDLEDELADDRIRELKESKLSAVRLLLECGADHNLRDNLGRTALDIAREKGNAPAVALFRAAEERRLERLHETARDRQAALRRRAPGSLRPGGPA